MIPPKLEKGDEIRIISPACSLSIVSDYNRELAIKRLTNMGFRVTFSKTRKKSTVLLLLLLLPVFMTFMKLSLIKV